MTTRRIAACKWAVPMTFALTWLAALPLAAQAQTASPAQAGFSAERLQRVDQFIERTMQAGEISGGVTLIARNGRIVYLHAQGVMDLQSKKPMQKDSIFRLASMTKPVAATALMMMVEEGKVRLTDPVSRFLPSFRDMKVAVARPAPPGPPPAPGTPAAPNFYTVPADRPITVLDLLTHTSGLMSGPIGNAAGNAAFQKRHDIGLKWVEDLSATPLEFQPGTRWSYSAVAGIDLIAHIVEIASGQDFREFLQQRLFQPLGMKETFYWPSAAQRARLVTAYDLRAGSLTPNTDPDSMSGEKYSGGGGGLMSTAESYARFAMMLANGGELNGVRILSPASVALMGSKIIPDTLPGRQPGEGYGLGVRFVNDRSARRTLVGTGSFGWSGAYGTHFWVDPEKKLVAILMLQTPGQPRTGDFETAVMQALME
ncbi:MAG TPA: serine hydrolase domain-containing protein [Steroidobacteraceae bacterium]|jgi:CubicO group peptidase (beta-lactamase class C family)|nr:serine hydrolase domain-containing protein [Steroidobacteraceae bacterium]